MRAGPVQSRLSLTLFFLIVTSVSAGCFFLLFVTAHNSLCGGSCSAVCLIQALISIPSPLYSFFYCPMLKFI